jgi:hypothetical protein
MVEKTQISLYQTVYPVFLFSKIFGLCTVNLDPKGYRQCLISFLWCLLAFAFYLFSIINHVLGSDLFPKNRNWILLIVNTLNSFTRMVSLILLSAIVLLSGPRVRKFENNMFKNIFFQIVKILQQIVQIDRDLASLNIRTNVKYFDKYVKLAVLAQSCHYLLYIILQYSVMHQHQGFESLLGDVSFIVAATVATLNTGVVLHQFLLLAWLLKKRFEWLNREFDNFYHNFKKFDSNSLK